MRDRLNSRRIARLVAGILMLMAALVMARVAEYGLFEEDTPVQATGTLLEGALRLAPRDQSPPVFPERFEGEPDLGDQTGSGGQAGPGDQTGSEAQTGTDAQTGPGSPTGVGGLTNPGVQNSPADQQDPGLKKPAEQRLIRRDVRLSLNLAAHRLRMFEGDEPVKVFSVGVGKLDAGTPTGNFRIINKLINPTWFPPESVENKEPVPPGPLNPLGTRWLGLSKSGYGLHGTNLPASVGQYVSLGCVRLFNDDVEWLTDQVMVGTPVEIRYDTVESAFDPFSGKPYLEVYPDAYRLDPGRDDRIRRMLGELGLLDRISADRLGRLLKRAGVAHTVISEGIPVFVNGELLTVGGIELQGVPYVPLRLLADSLGFKITWDAALGMVMVEGQPVPTAVRVEGTMVVPAKDLPAYLPGSTTRIVERNLAVEVSFLRVYWNDKPVFLPSLVRERKVWFPLAEISARVNRRFVWSAEKQAALSGGTEIRGWMREDRLWISNGGLASLGLELLWSPLSGRVEIRSQGRGEGREDPAVRPSPGSPLSLMPVPWSSSPGPA
ncbi:MAG: L,D-transpeptidase family protein [Firmicutes bacterium]|nr:L,D-transpeptidase family protein [Bacillota bacterium]